MSKRFLALLLALGLIVAGSTSVAFAKKHKKTVKLTAEIAQVSPSGASPIIDAGTVRPIVGARFPLERSADAMRLIDERGATGKVVLDVGEG